MRVLGYVFLFAIGIIIGFQFASQKWRLKYKEKNELNKKMIEFYNLLVQWVRLEVQNNNLISFFIKHGYESVAIYGMKELGVLLYQELKNSQVDVKYCIDRDADFIYADVDILKPTDELIEVDVIIVTAIHYYNEIEKQLKEKVQCDIVNLDDILFSV